jgi:uncharacterized membrane protein YfcA
MKRLLSYSPWAAAALYSYGLGAATHYLCLGGSEWWTAIALMVEGIVLFWVGEWLRKYVQAAD